MYNGNPICPACVHKEEEYFQVVKEYIWNNQHATVTEVSQATGVSTEKILRYLREGRLELSDQCVNLFLDCERCGVPIKSGRYCEKCTVEMEKILKEEAKSLNKKVNPTQPSTAGGKMHVADIMRNRK